MPSAPGSPVFVVTAQGASASAVAVSWAAAPNATSYRYTAGRSSGPAWPNQAGTSTLPSAGFTAVPNGLSLWFCAFGVNSAGESGSACNAFTVPSQPPPPAPTVQVQVKPGRQGGL